MSQIPQINEEKRNSFKEEIIGSSNYKDILDIYTTKKNEENKENDHKNINSSKAFVPKFETMNDKPKPKKGNLLKSYNDEY